MTGEEIKVMSEKLTNGFKPPYMRNELAKNEAKLYRVGWEHPTLGNKFDFVYGCSKSDVKRHIRNEFENARIIEVIEWIEPEQSKSTLKDDNVNSPAHYTQGGIECIDAIKAAVIGLKNIEAVCTANIIKYLWRWKFKNGLEDLKKAKWYLDYLIKEVTKNGEE